MNNNTFTNNFNIAPQIYPQVIFVAVSNNQPYIISPQLDRIQQQYGHFYQHGQLAYSNIQHQQHVHQVASNTAYLSFQSYPPHRQQAYVHHNNDNNPSHPLITMASPININIPNQNKTKTAKPTTPTDNNYISPINSVKIIKESENVPLKIKKSFKCDICNKCLSRKSNLKQHLKIHSNTYDFYCEYKNCDKRFKQKHSLIDHIRTHTGERPFKCEYCPKAFKVKHNLNTHRRLHTGERPYVCSRCFKRFASKSSLNGHVKKKHPPK